MAMSAPGLTGVGLEDLTMTDWVSSNGCYDCWVKGNRIIFVNNDIGLAGFVANFLYANNYTVATNGGLHTIGVGSENDQATYASNVLILNNIFYDCYIEENGVTGYVQAYNYFLGADYAGDFPHNPGGQTFMLREGNRSNMSWDDDTWTAHNWSTWFRNFEPGYDPVSGQIQPTPIDVGGFSRFNNVIGNIIGSPQSTGTYGQVLGVNRNGVDTTGLTLASLFRWGNFVVCTGDATHCNVATGAFDNSEVPTNLSSFPNSVPYQNSIPANHSLPASFFMNSMTAHPSGGTGLSWWKTCNSWATFPTTCASYTSPPMPPIGPDVTGGQDASGHAYQTPAQIAWNNLPLDPAFGGVVRKFDQRVFQTDGNTPPPVTAPSPASFTGIIGVSGSMQVGQ